MIHTLLVQPKPETTPEEMETVISQVKALQQKIPGITNVQAGKNRNPNNYGYTYGFILYFVDEAHFQAYFPHPEHRAVGAELRRLCTTLLNFDIPQE